MKKKIKTKKPVNYAWDLKQPKIPLSKFFFKVAPKKFLNGDPMQKKVFYKVREKKYSRAQILNTCLQHLELL